MYNPNCPYVLTPLPLRELKRYLIKWIILVGMFWWFNVKISFYLYGFTNVSSNLCYLRKSLDIGYKAKNYHLYVFSNVSSKIHYLRISSDTELKGMVSHLYVFWRESLNIYYLWKDEDIYCKCIFFTCIYSPLSLQITNKWKCLLAMIVWVCFLTSIYFQISFQISFILESHWHWS